MFSVMAFVLFEVYKARRHTTKMFLELNALLKGPLDEFEQREHELALRESRRLLEMAKVWNIASVLTIYPGVTGALVLMWAFDQRLWKLLGWQAMPGVRTTLNATGLILTLSGVRVAYLNLATIDGASIDSVALERKTRRRKRLLLGAMCAVLVGAVLQFVSNYVP